METEVWIDIKDHYGYQVSNFGNVRSLDRMVKSGFGSIRMSKGVNLKQAITSAGYRKVFLNNKTKSVHQLVAMAFLNHIPNGSELVINHKDFDKQNNHVSNLELVTTRENSNKKHLPSSSNYVGVNWRKDINKWQSRIEINGKRNNLGTFINEYDAHLAYEKALSNHLLSIHP